MVLLPAPGVPPPPPALAPFGLVWLDLRLSLSSVSMNDCFQCHPLRWRSVMGNEEGKARGSSRTGPRVLPRPAPVAQGPLWPLAAVVTLWGELAHPSRGLEHLVISEKQGRFASSVKEAAR